jgi:hypothetical protein
VETYSVKLSGQEIARLTGDGITPSKREQFIQGTFRTEMVDDPKMLKIVKDGKTVLVLYVSNSTNVEVEKVNA